MRKGSFQERIARIVRGLPAAQDFALAGGAALVLQGYPQRVTNDLDYFATAPAAVDNLLPILESALRAAGMTVERRQVAPGFARLEASEGGNVCEIDLGYDYRLRSPEPSPLGPVLTAEELAADKTLAVHGRALARDYVDVRALMRRFGGEQLLAWAAQKDPGFSREAFIYRLEQIERLPREDFALGDADLAALKDDLAVWRDELMARERETTTDLHRSRDRDPPEIGF